jgi:hypothetical protein
MKIFFKILLITLLFPVTIESQEIKEPKTLELSKKIKWSITDKMLHAFYQYDGENLSSFDYIQGKEAWSVSIPGFKETEITMLKDDPYIRLSKNKPFTENINQAILINRITGKIEFNTNEIDDYQASQIFYSKDHQYVLMLNVERIKKDKKKGIERQVYRHISLVKIGELKKLWITTLPEPESINLFGLKIKQTNIEYKPIANQNTIVFSFSGILYGFDVNNGNIVWENKLKDLDINKLYTTKTNNTHFLATNNSKNGTYSMDFRSFETGLVDESKHIDLGKYYNIIFNKESMQISSSKGFNYINYDGSKKWDDWIPTMGYIEEVYKQGENHLIVQNIGGKYYANWINENGENSFLDPVAIHNKTIRDGILLNDYLIVVTNQAIKTFDINESKQITSVPLQYYEPFKIDETTKSVVYSFKGKTAFILDTKAKKPRAFTEKKFFERNKDTITRIESFNGKYTFISPNEMTQFESNGTQVNSIYYKPPMQIMKTLVPIAVLALGTIFADEVDKINRQLYKSGIKNTRHHFKNDITFMAYTDSYGVPNFGRGLIALQGAYQVAEHFPENKKDYNPYHFIDKLWFVRDKIDNIGWGLRIIDTEKGEEIIHLPIDKKDFSYSVDALAQTVIVTINNQILFYNLN